MYSRKISRAVCMAGATSAIALICAAGLLIAQQPGRLTVDARREIGKPALYRNLTLFPVYDSAARSSTPYATLDEGLRAKTVRVRESRQGGDVNTLYVTNTGSKPVYLMAGEVVLGGQQDRCLGRDVIVRPGKKDLAVTVFCVEHGRWSGHRDFEDSAITLAAADIRANAQEGAFAAGRQASAGVAGMGGMAANSRVQGRGVVLDSGAAVGERQQKVWDSVAAKNAKFKASPSSGTYREVLNQSGGEAKQSIAPYVKALSGVFPADPHLVGAVAAVNGEVVSADIFGDSALFRKLWPKLLRSYAADAAEKSGVRAKKAAVTQGDAKAFLVSASDAKSKLENRSEVSTSMRLETPSSVAFQLREAKQMGGGMGGAGASVHTNVLKK